MNKTIAVELVTPEKVVAKTQADFLALPAWTGEMGVLPGHEPYLAQLRDGEVRLSRAGVVEAFAISGGFAEIGPSGVSLFVETAELAGQIDAERARQEAEKAKASLARKGGDPETLAGAEGALRWARAQIKVARRHRHTHAAGGPHSNPAD
ncbi:MAG: ATP synthase F1 subunit epsilon [Elusimicrobiota bacterium]